MTTKSDRNLSHVEAVAAGLVSDYETKLPADLSFPMINKRASDWGTKVDPSYDQSNNKQLMDAMARSMVKEGDMSFLMKTEAVKADAGKLDWSLVPFEALEDMVAVLEFGAKKYSRNNWQTNGGFSWIRVFASTLRHLFAWKMGQDNDPESGLPHIAHAQCNLLFLAYYIKNRNSLTKDDRKA